VSDMSSLTGAASGAGAAGPSLGILAHVETELSVVIGRSRRSIDELLRLGPGSVIELDHRPGDPVEILANGTVIARGDIVAVDRELGIRVTEIVSSDNGRT
jgi:flagellar motor switch protein FliN/FliY